jgi:Fe2+ transport system protein FeoA
VFSLIPLHSAKIDKKYKIIEIKGGSNADQRLSDLGLYIGATITLKRSSFGPILVQVLDSTVAIGRKIAQKIYVDEI